MLQERRTALISAAVTGQIEVRDLGRAAGSPAAAGLPAVNGAPRPARTACRENALHQRNAIELPNAAVHPHPLLNGRIPGVVEMKRFWRSGDPADLPENPDVAVVMDWLNRIAGSGGFEHGLS